MSIGIGLPVESKYIARRPQQNHFGPTHWKAVGLFDSQRRTRCQFRRPTK
jgi:hypothetical protein